MGFSESKCETLHEKESVKHYREKERIGEEILKIENKIKKIEPLKTYALGKESTHYRRKLESLEEKEHLLRVRLAAEKGRLLYISEWWADRSRYQTLNRSSYVPFYWSAVRKVRAYWNA